MKWEIITRQRWKTPAPLALFGNLVKSHPLHNVWICFDLVSTSPCFEDEPTRRINKKRNCFFWSHFKGPIGHIYTHQLAGIESSISASVALLGRNEQINNDVWMCLRAAGLNTKKIKQHAQKKSRTLLTRWINLSVKRKLLSFGHATNTVYSLKQSHFFKFFNKNIQQESLKKIYVHVACMIWSYPWPPLTTWQCSKPLAA